MVISNLMQVATVAQAHFYRFEATLLATGTESSNSIKGILNDLDTEVPDADKKLGDVEKVVVGVSKEGYGITKKVAIIIIMIIAMTAAVGLAMASNGASTAEKKNKILRVICAIILISSLGSFFVLISGIKLFG